MPSTSKATAPIANVENVVSVTTTPIVTVTETSNSTANEASGSKTKASKKCIVCNHTHYLTVCKAFQKLPHEERLRLIVLHGYCARCLSPFHSERNCKSTKMCKICRKQQRTIHKRKNVKQRTVQSRPRNESSCLQLPVRHMVTFSPTARVLLETHHKNIPVRAVIDLCCAHSYICEELVKALKLPTLPFNSGKLCRIRFKSMYDSKNVVDATVKVTSMLKIKTPLMSVSDSIKESFVGMELADPNFYISANVALVIGPELAPQVLKGKIQSNPGLPLAQYTVFGWVISGPSPF